ncbi:NAD(P)H-quinone oxidoreductase subunit U, chloroplastic-like isoform X2 [Phragmites australis]|uniref:NAD(P)H-quinone oxidoreductase subunit U, chloroplastic-like isoform X2 n=1 Tax=Phragmites australis TaxID=29695 RepID=UPI002D7A149A|nr:NAD(P)H-quinone oxidoreductase subunit U, chloroplastic-like isoform X2 [Phragmites australis]
MASAVGITSLPTPSDFAPPSSSFSYSKPGLRRRRLPVRLVAAASFRARCAAAADGGAEAPEGASAVAEVVGDLDAGTDVAGGAATSTRPPYSLISADNVQKAMRGLAITDADHYGRLGVTKLASTDEVKAAYEKKCEELNSEGPEEEELNKEHDLLKESFTILSTEEERRLYDWSLSRSGQPERYVWPFQVDPLELAPDPPKEPEDEFPTKLVGYFFLAWFILSVAFSVTLNR